MPVRPFGATNGLDPYFELSDLSELSHPPDMSFDTRRIRSMSTAQLRVLNARYNRSIEQILTSHQSRTQNQNSIPVNGQDNHQRAAFRTSMHGSAVSRSQMSTYDGGMELNFSSTEERRRMAARFYVRENLRIQRRKERPRRHSQESSSPEAADPLQENNVSGKADSSTVAGPSNLKAKKDKGKGKASDIVVLPGVPSAGPAPTGIPANSS